MGGNTADVLKYLVDCPIGTVPDCYDFDFSKEIVFTTDLKHTFKKYAVAPLLTLSGLWDYNLSVVYLDTQKYWMTTKNRTKNYH